MLYDVPTLSSLFTISFNTANKANLFFEGAFLFVTLGLSLPRNSGETYMVNYTLEPYFHKPWSVGLMY
jgi:hypothetical protein